MIFSTSIISLLAMIVGSKFINKDDDLTDTNNNDSVSSANFGDDQEDEYQL